MKRITLFFCLITTFMACHHDDDEKEQFPPELAKHTVMVYMAGENNLTVSNGYRFLNIDLQEIVKGSKTMTNDQRLLVFIDSLNTNSKQAGKPAIFEVHGGKMTKLHEFGTDFYACDPVYFKQVMEWMVDSAKAESYGLVLWGHACGWVVSNDTIADNLSRTPDTRAYGQDTGQDEQKQGTKWMNITQMSRALKGLPKLEYIFADCCNMMCAEVGYELRDVTKYLIGSPAEIPGEGAPYDKILPYLYKSDSEMYKGIIDTYYDYYLEDYKTDSDLKGYSVPLSVIDTRYISQLAQATRDVLDKFGDGYPRYPESPDMSDIAHYWYFDGPMMFDMKAFIKQHTTSADYNSWEQTYKLAVPYYRMSLRWMTIYYELERRFNNFNQDHTLYGCVSMFIPLNLADYYTGTFKYNYTYNHFEWNRIVDWSRFGWEY